MAASVPVDLYDRDALVIRPRDLAGRWANPTRELARLERNGLVRRAGHGYWVIPPADRLTDPGWRPELEAVALGLAVADYGLEATALMGLSAARYHGALPRAVATAVVAVPRQRPVLRSPFGPVLFVQRDTGRLATEPARTTLVDGQVTTLEQTMLDLADRPHLGGFPPRDVGDAIVALAVRADWGEALDLARRQRLHAAYRRARWLAAGAVSPLPPDWPGRRPVPGLGLRHADAGDATRHGIAPDAPA